MERGRPFVVPFKGGLHEYYVYFAYYVYFVTWDLLKQSLFLKKILIFSFYTRYLCVRVLFDRDLQNLH